MTIELILAILIGYVLGSIPFALVIGKVFYNTDVRKYGSGNLGGSNAGRVLGKEAGISVILLDVLKVVLAIYITSKFKHGEIASIWAGVAAAFGHCYPIFANFKGGKAVATTGGFLIGITLFTFHNVFMILLPLAVFLVVLYAKKWVALASICAAITSTLYIFLVNDNMMVKIASLILTILIIYRHKANIQRMKEGTENKITWL